MGADIPMQGEVSDMPSGWTEVSLAQLGQWAGGGTPTKENSAYWFNGTIPWVSPKDMKSSEIFDAQDHITVDALKGSATCELPAETVLMVTRSGILRHSFPVAVAKIAVAINQDIKAITPHAGIVASYVAYALRAYGREILHLCAKAGTTVQSIESPALRRFQIPLAPTREQQRIVERSTRSFQI